MHDTLPVARGFINGTIAQLVEHRTENPCVPGSIPGGTTTKNPNYMFGFFGLISNSIH